MKKFVVLLILLSVGKVAVAYAAETNPSSRNFIFGNSVQSANNLNQVLVLLTGKDGVPGAVGVAGRDGLRGVDGLRGIPGIQGAPGVAGQAGPAGPAGAQGLQGLQGLQGIAGAAGGAGPQGIQGIQGEPGGGTGGGNLDYGIGEVSVGACDDAATVGVKAKFITYGNDPVKNDFVFDRITIDELNADCVDQTLKFYFNVKDSPVILSDPYDLYNNGDYLECVYLLTARNEDLQTGWDGTSQVLLASTTPCTNLTLNRSVTLGQISTADFTDAIGFEIS